MEERPQQLKNNNAKNLVKSMPLRRIGPHTDVTRGIHFTPTLEPLRTLLLDGYINYAKYRLILAIMANDASFQIKRLYLEKRFGNHTLKRYIPELTAQKVIEVEDVLVATKRFPRGQICHAYHVNSVTEWRLPEFDVFVKENAVAGAYLLEMIDSLRMSKHRAYDPAFEQGDTSDHPANEQAANEQADTFDHPANEQAANQQAANQQDVNETNLNQINLNQINPNSNPRTTYPQPRESSSYEPSRRELIGAMASIYEPTTKRETIDRLVDHLRRAHRSRDILDEIEYHEEQLSTHGSLFTYRPSHKKAWSDAIADGIARLASPGFQDSEAPYRSPDLGNDQESGYA